MNELQTFLAGPAGPWLLIGLAVLALAFLALWLRARSGGGDGETKKQLRAAQNEVRLLKGDAIQAKRDHAAEVEKLTKELETLRAVAGGRVPPELEMWKNRAETAEKRLSTEIPALIEKHKAELAAAGVPSMDSTMIAPSTHATRDRMERLERELAEAQRQIQQIGERHRGEMAALTERLQAEKAAALTTQAARHGAEMEALHRQLGGEGAAPRPVMPAAALPEGTDLDPSTLPYLEVVSGGTEGLRYYLPYGAASLGRDETSTVVINDEQRSISRHHADVLFDGVDFILKDNNAKNGTFLNQTPVTTVRLQFGDVVGLGDQIQLRFDSAASEAASTNPAAAVAAYEAMLKVAPNCRLALQGLAALLDEDPARRSEANAVNARLQELPAHV